jgi:hypothetical protein
LLDGQVETGVLRFHPGPLEGRIAIVTDVGCGMRWTRQRQGAGQIVRMTNDVAADGEVVWSWRSDAGAKVVKTLPRLTGDGGNQAWSPRRARISVCRGKARFLRGCKSLPARVAPAGSNRSSREGNDPAEASDVKGH